MTFKKILSCMVMAAVLGGSPAFAQAKRDPQPPSEVPPASYTGRQYVDSKGCVYIRAGVDGSVNWIPRLTRARDHICGAKPTSISGTTVAQAPSQAPVMLPPPSDVAAAAPARVAAPTKVQTAKAQAPRVQAPRVQKAATAPRPKAVATKPRSPMMAQAARPAPMAPIAVPQPRPTVLAAPSYIQPVTPRRVSVVPGQRAVALGAASNVGVKCRNLSPVAQRYMGNGPDVRCGPQANWGSARANSVQAYQGYAQPQAIMQPRAYAPEQAANVVRITPSTRIVPRHVYNEQIKSADLQSVPNGYRAAWEDDRLNPKRAHQSLEGKRQMELRWTREVPRRLIDISAGREVTSLFPDLVYPYTSMQMQQDAMAGRIIVQPRAGQQMRLSSKSVAPQRVMPTQAATGARYVQVGTFGEAANARNTVSRLQSMGLPVRVGSSSRGGRNYQTVLAGPFSSQNELARALDLARRAGFRDAFARK